MKILINNNINNLYLSNNKNYLYKYYNSDSNLLGMKSSNKNKKNIKNCKYKTNKSIKNNYIKKKILFTPKLSNEKKIILTKGFYRNRSCFHNIQTKNIIFKKYRKSNSTLYLLNNKYNLNSFSNNFFNSNNRNNNGEDLKCEIIQLTPNVKKKSKIYKTSDKKVFSKKCLPFK